VKSTSAETKVKDQSLVGLFFLQNVEL